MPVKNLRGEKPALKNKMKKVISTFSFSKTNLFENITEKEKKDLLANCSMLFKNPALQKICDDIYTQELLNAFAESSTHEKYLEARGRIFGIASVIQTIEGFHLEYMDSIKKQESFDRQEII